MYEAITKHIPALQTHHFGDWVIDTKNDGNADRSRQFAYVKYSQTVRTFVNDFYQFVEDNPGFKLRNYIGILEENSIKWLSDSMIDADVSNLDARCILALILGAIRAERFGDGMLLRFLESGALVRWLKQLRKLDETM